MGRNTLRIENIIEKIFSSFKASEKKHARKPSDELTALSANENETVPTLPPENILSNLLESESASSLALSYLKTEVTQLL